MEKKQQHTPDWTPEPWFYVENTTENKQSGPNHPNGAFEIHAPKETAWWITPVNLVASCNAYEFYSQNKNTSKANAARIVSCVNALAGIENPEKFVAQAEIWETQTVEMRKKIKEQDQRIASLTEQLEQASERGNRYATYLSLTLDGVEPEDAARECNLI